MIFSGKTQNADMMQIQKVVDFLKKLFLVCLSPVYSSDFIRISHRSSAFHLLVSWTGVSRLPSTWPQVLRFPVPLVWPFWSSRPGPDHQFSPVFLVQQENGCCLSPPSPHQLLMVGFLIEPALWYVLEVQCCKVLFCFAFFFSSSCLDFIVSTVKQDCCRWSFLIFGFVLFICQKSHVQ